MFKTHEKTLPFLKEQLFSGDPDYNANALSALEKINTKASRKLLFEFKQKG